MDCLWPSPKVSWVGCDAPLLKAGLGKGEGASQQEEGPEGKDSIGIRRLE